MEEESGARFKMISDCFIKPKFISEEASKPTYLAAWDLAMININYIQKGLLYPLPEDLSITTFLHKLKDSLSATLTHFHPLAGRLASVKQSANPTPSMAVFINPEESPGVRFIHASVNNLTIDDILTPTDVPQIVQSFFDHHKAIGHDGQQQPLLSIQVTELVDGIFIGCSMNHMLVDGSSFWHFFKSLSEVFQSKPISRPPVLTRWGSDPILTSFPLTHEFEDQYIDRPSPALVRQRIFHLTRDSLAKLKAKVNSECTTNTISTLQALSGVVWRCVTRARRFPAEEETACRISVNNRSRISPPLPENYFGNSIQTVGMTTTAGELLDHSIGWAAWRLHEAVVNHGDKQVREHMDSWPFVYKMGLFFDGKGVQIGSSPRFDMYGIEFGLGKGVAVLGGNANRYDGKVTLYQGRDGRGSMDLELCLLPEHMALFESDQEFMTLVQL